MIDDRYDFRKYRMIFTNFNKIIASNSTVGLKRYSSNIFCLINSYTQKPDRELLGSSKLGFDSDIVKSLKECDISCVTLSSDRV